eukprot:s5046_g4.t1
MDEIIDLEANDVIVIDDEAESNIAAAVLCVNVATHTGPEQLFDFLRRREVCGAVDVRLRPTRAAAALRRFAVSQGLDWEWRPALAATGSTGAEAAERAAVLVRLAKAAWTKHQNGGRNKLPCVLFEGEDWHNCTARRRLAEELRQRGVALRHAGNTPEEDEQPLEVPKELVAAAAKAAKDAEAAAVPPIREPEPPQLSDPPSASQAARPATARAGRGRASRKRGASGPATVFEALEEAAELFVGLRHARAERLMVDRKLCNMATDRKGTRGRNIYQADHHKPSRFEGMSGQLPDAGLAVSPLVPAWSWLREKWRSALRKLFVALAAAGLSMLVYQRLRRAIRMSRLVDEQLERWTKKGPAKEPVVECEVPVEHGATGQDVDLDVVEVPVGLAFECERIRQQLRQKFSCESDVEVVEALLGHFKEREGMVPEEEALLQLPWIDVAALAQLTYWYDRRPRETEEVQDVPKEERNRDAKYGRWTKKIGREKVIYSSVGLKSRVRTRGHLGAKVFRRPAGVDVTRLSTLQRAASLCGHEPLLSLVESTMDSLRPKNVARIAWSEVEAHNSKDDLWLLIDGKVYDVTSFLSLHPGGGQLVVDAAAQDATSLFERTHGEGLRYSLRLLNQFFIGVCDNPAQAKPAEPEAPSMEFLQTLRSITGALHTFDEAKATGEAQGILKKVFSPGCARPVLPACLQTIASAPQWKLSNQDAFRLHRW